MAKERLYIIMRSDMTSMTSGKGMAQASHASNAFVKHAKDSEYNIEKWENSTSQGFGTVYVLDGGSISSIKESVDPLIEMGFVAGYVFDPTYPVLDGAVVHSIPLITCAYVYCDEINEKIVTKFLEKFKLHP